VTRPRRIDRPRLDDAAREILGRPLTDHESSTICKYLNLLSEWNTIFRLVGSSNPEWLVEHVILDSLLYLRVLPPAVNTLVDLGAGAGIPGVVLSIVLADTAVTLVEAQRRRASFLAAVVRETDARNLRVVNERLDALTVPREMSGTFDAAVMRCAGDLETVIPIGLELVRPRGVVIASGPPRTRPLVQGEWITVPGVKPGTSRRFAVVVRSQARPG